jgi:GNAT superfamily N-acetyltransferase
MSVALRRAAARLRFTAATEADVTAITTIRNEVSAHLTRQFGRGHWSGRVTERGVGFGLRTSKVLVARRGPRVVGTLRLQTKKPWAIDRSYFVDVTRPLYLLDMAVAPGFQRQGIGRQLMDAARAAAIEWPAGAIRLDAYDALAGAGNFYARCGYREVGRVVYRRVPLIYFELLLPEHGGAPPGEVES